MATTELTPEDCEVLAAQCILATLEFSSPEIIESLTSISHEFCRKAVELRSKKGCPVEAPSETPSPI